MHPVPKPDRRSPSRPLDPSTCPECHALATPALFRTDTAVYDHCARCAYLWCYSEAGPNDQQRSGFSPLRLGIVSQRVKGVLARRNERPVPSHSTESFRPAGTRSHPIVMMRSEHT